MKQTKADMQVASFPFRLQSLVKMLILEGSKRMLALIWTTLRDLRGKQGSRDVLRHGMPAHICSILQKSPTPPDSPFSHLFTLFLNIEKVLRKTKGHHSMLLYSQLIYVAFEE